MVLASLLFMRRMAQTTRGRFVEHGLPSPVPPGVTVYDLTGPLFFGAAERAMGALRAIGEHVKVVVFRMDQVTTVDVTSLVALETVLSELARHGIKVVLVGVGSDARALFTRAGVVPVEGTLAFAATVEEAFALLGAKLPRYRRVLVGPVRVHVLDRHRRAVAKAPRPVE